MTEVLRGILAAQQTGRGARGVVAAAAPLAAALGAEKLREGGNAYDAVVTAALAETVLLPPKCGLAGDLVALRWEQGADAPEALLAIGGAPAGLAAAAGAGLPDTGPLAVGVPGAPDGYAQLAHYGAFERVALAAPAQRLARDGFVWSPVCTSLTEESIHLLQQHNRGPIRYLPTGAPIAPGTVTTLPGLARALSHWADEGADMLAGAVGEAIVSRVRAAGGVLDESDMRYGGAEWCEPATVRTEDGCRAWATPAPTYGPYLLESLPDLHRARTPGEVWDIVQGVTARRRELLADSRVASTSMVSAADEQGTVVVLMHSNSYPRFGSGLVVDEFDLILANRAGRGFTAVPGHPNHPAAGKRPATTLHVWAFAPADGQPSLLGATPGGANQLPWNTQLLHQLVTGEHDPGTLVTSPRWEWEPETGGVRLEAGFDRTDIATLTDRALTVEPVEALALRCAQQVIARPRSGQPLVAAVDPRTGGAVVAV